MTNPNQPQPVDNRPIPEPRCIFCNKITPNKTVYCDQCKAERVGGAGGGGKTTHP